MKNQKDKKAVLVMGMHRSGTSVLTAGLEAMGVFLGRKTGLAGIENPKGFFENADVTGFNRRLLQFFGARWDNPFFDCIRALRETEAASMTPWYDEAVALLQKNFSGKSIWGIKDPRLCLLLPFWERALSLFGFDRANTFFIFIVRNPMEVAISQYKRRMTGSPEHFIGKEYAQTMLLWLVHYLRPFASLYSDNNLFLTYEGFVGNTLFELERISSFLEIDTREETARKKIAAFAESFVDKSLYRSRTESIEDENFLDAHKDAGEMYASLLSIANEKSVPVGALKCLLEKQKKVIDAFDLVSPFSEPYSRAWYLWRDAESKFAGKDKEAKELKKGFDRERRMMAAAFENEKKVLEEESMRAKKALKKIYESTSWRIVVRIMKFLRWFRKGS